MEDIAPELLEAIRASFTKNIGSNAAIRRLTDAIEAGTATYIEAEEYAYEVGEALAKAFGTHLSSAVLPDGKMYYNIANRVLRPLLEEDHTLVSTVAEQVQTALNKAAGIGLKAQTVKPNEDRIQGILDKVSEAETFDDVAWVLDDPVKNFSMNVVDETLKANISFQGKAGLRPRIIRKAEYKCCQWCSRLEGAYDYPNVPDGVYQRHERCRCTVDYDPGTGKRQNVWTKGWTNSADSGILEARKTVGISTFVSKLAQHPKRLASFTPAKLYAALKAEGLDVRPLMQGSLRGVPFENGGGFKVNFEDGGLFQYHPAARSHHGGAYYKISTGKGGTHRYDLDGNEIDG